MIIGIIPARGGSKGIPKKNLVQICGKPLIYWTIKSAFESKLLDTFFVSTEDINISNYCKSLGVKVIIRPKELSTDESKTIDLLHYHLINDFNSSANLCTLQPTSPIRLDGTIDKCIKDFIDKKPSILASGYISKVFEFGTNNNIPRQKILGFFYDDGNIYIHSTKSIKNKIWSSKETLKFYTKEQENYEIDTYLDLKVVEFLLSKELNKKDEI